MILDELRSEARIFYVLAVEAWLDQGTSGNRGWYRGLYRGYRMAALRFRALAIEAAVEAAAS